MKIRVLQLEYWMKLVGDPEWQHMMPKLDTYEAPFNRPGYYCVTYNRYRTDCWFQSNEGQAFRYDPELFMYSLALLEAESADVPRLKRLVASKSASWEQKEKLRMWHEAVSIRNTCRQHRKKYISVRDTL